MVVTVFSPAGIVTATSCIDTFIESIQDEEVITQKSIRIEGLPHSYVFWDKFVLTFNILNQNNYDYRLLNELDKLAHKWESRPLISEFMPYVKKMILDTHIQIIGVMSGYDLNENNIEEQYVYQILGENIRRINRDDNGVLNYNCVYLEKDPYIGKLFQSTKMLNGNDWENIDCIRIRCDLFSISKAIDLCSFMLKTSFYMENMHNANYSDPLKIETSIVRCNEIEIKTINI